MLPVIAPMRRVLVLSVVFFVAGCGRKATRADCEHFFNKNVEVKLKSEGITDPPAIAKRQAELRASLQDDLDKCVGRRITDRMLTCVDNAQTDTDIDKCLR